MTMQTVLDPCCGSRMMWLDKADPRAVFGDRRSEMLTEAFERWQSMLAGGGADADSSPAELVQQGLQQAMEDFRELAQIEAESRGRAWKTLQDRMQQNLADMQKRLTPKP